MSDEFEVGHELDRALRSVMTGLAQVIERAARNRQEGTRAAAAEARQEWLAHRDAARQQYVPWMRPGAVERSDAVSASRVWGVAAAWSTMDPLARGAEEQLAARIKQAHGEHPSVFLRNDALTSSVSVPPETAEVRRLLTMQEALDLAKERAPYYYTEHEGLTPSRDVPMTPAEERVHADWQYYSETGTLPERSQWEAWAKHAGHDMAEFAPERWRTAEGALDDAGLDAELGRIWQAGSEQRGQRDRDEQTVAVAAAQLAQQRTQAGEMARFDSSPAASPDGEGSQLSRERVLELNGQAQAYFAEQLREGSPAAKYLSDRIGADAAAGPFALGYAPDGWTSLTKHLKDKGASDAEILAAGLGRTASNGNVIDAFRNRAMLGIRDADGALVGFVGRDLSGDSRAPEFTMTGTTAAFRKSDAVFGLAEAGDASKLLRVDSPFDAAAVTATNGGEVAGVALLGSTMSSEQAQAIVAKSTQVWLADTRDSGRRRATEHDLETLTTAGAEVRPAAEPAAAAPAVPPATFSLGYTIDENTSGTSELSRDEAVAYLERDHQGRPLFAYGEGSSWVGRDPEIDRLLLEKGVLTALPTATQYAQPVNAVESVTSADAAEDRSADVEERDAALQQVWAEGTEERSLRELEEHQVAMAQAGMPDLRTQVAVAPSPSSPAQPFESAWVNLVNPGEFDQAQPQEIAQAWRDARSRGAAGDVAAQAAATQIGEHLRTKYGVNPDDYLLGAMTERAAVNTELRRTAEDKARKATEEARSESPLVQAAMASWANVEATGQAPAPAPAPRFGAAAAAEGPQLPRERVLELNQQAQAYFAGNLRAGSAGHRYLVDRLGESVTEGPWTLGYAPAGWTGLTNQLKRQGASDEEILGAGLGRLSSKGNVIDAFRDRAMLGIRDADGELVGFVGRDLSGDERAPKYVNTGQTSAFHKSDLVFGLHEAPEGAKLVRTEGPFDAIATSLAGDGEVAGLALMGTAMSDSQAAQLAARSDGRVWLAPDLDKPGLQAAEHDFYTLAKHGVKTRVVTVPGDDPASAWQENPTAMREAMSSLDTAPSAGELVIGRFVDDNADSLAAGDRDAHAGLSDTVTRVTDAVGDPAEAEVLAARAEQRREALVRRSDEARVDGVSLEVQEQRIDYAAEHAASPAREERLEQAGDRVGRRADARDAAGDRLEAASARVDLQPEAPYDRARESQLEVLDDAAREARVASSHGPSMSTADAVGRTSPGRRGTQARRSRGGDAQQHGRSRGL